MNSVGEQTRAATRRTVLKLSLATAVMFSFGYALVPLYNVFCEVTGLNGKTGRLTEAQAAALKPDIEREITVEFVTNVDSQLPWDFKPKVSKVVVHPGVETQVEFQASNWSQGPIVAQAVPSVAPNTMARYFKKTECFCFSQQRLAAGESKTMPVRFIVDPKLPAEITVLSLGYTFFETPASAEGSAEKSGPPKS
jgi:cytochrome c oxidase assembly protein subunit 11